MLEQFWASKPGDQACDRSLGAVREIPTLRGLFVKQLVLDTVSLRGQLCSLFPANMDKICTMDL